jgi:phosphatidylglycerophosphatase C
MLAIFDLDGTLTKVDTYQKFLVWVMIRHPGCWHRLWQLPLGLARYYGKQQDHTWLKCHFLKTILAGSNKNKITTWSRSFTEDLIRYQMRPGAIKALQKHRHQGDHLVLATASFDFYVEDFARQLGFERVVCTGSAWDSKNRLLGILPQGNCHGIQKLIQIKAQLPKSWQIQKKTVYTDHHSDIPLLEWVDRACPVNPSSKLKAWAKKKGLPIYHW